MEQRLYNQDPLARGSGILLHITSLPSKYGIGDFGPDAYRFVEFLSETSQKYWQILPLNLTCPEYGNSPYSSFSAYAGNVLMISLDILIRDGLLTEDDIQIPEGISARRVNYPAVIRFKERILNLAYERNSKQILDFQEFSAFCRDHADWLDDYALFISLKRHFNGAPWDKWSDDIRDRTDKAIRQWTSKLSDQIQHEKFFQYLFFKQWLALKQFCNLRDIKIIGDIPIYVNYDSADVWANPGIFSLDENRQPLYVAGVPPDYFSSTGQLWGHPVYKWDVLGESGYQWWLKRIGHNLTLFHLFRLDHFRGFVGFWQVHSSEKTAINGKWVHAPAGDFFTTLIKQYPSISIIAEDLGIITPDVRDIIKRFNFPGMKVLLFAFGEDLPTNPYAPHNHIRNCVIYTGTHDNNTIKGWYKNEADEATRKRLAEYIGRELSEKTVHWDLIRLAMMSVADAVIIPMQDILGLGAKYRMNLPATSEGNWEWRVTFEQLSSAVVKKLSNMTAIYGRSNARPD